MGLVYTSYETNLSQEEILKNLEVLIDIKRDGSFKTHWKNFLSQMLFKRYSATEGFVDEKRFQVWFVDLNGRFGLTGNLYPVVSGQIHERLERPTLVFLKTRINPTMYFFIIPLNILLLYVILNTSANFIFPLLFIPIMNSWILAAYFSTRHAVLKELKKVLQLQVAK